MKPEALEQAQDLLDHGVTRHDVAQELEVKLDTFYWINDAIGRPFFLIEKTNDPGLVQVVEHDIVPRLLDEVPNQHDEKVLTANPYLFINIPPSRGRKAGLRKKPRLCLAGRR